jgi:L-2-hydroxyglutarate oxidase LhgO
MSETSECIVIGAGVIGLAVARELAGQGRDVVVLEAAGAIGTGTSSRNSEVIHAGIYYDQGSLKARLCVRGKAMLYDYCESHGIPHKRLGKLIVATHEDQLAALEALHAKSRDNGVDDLEWLDAAAVARMEPALTASAALLSPSSGILDTHALMLGLQGDAEAEGAVVALGSPVLGGEVGNGITVRVGGAEPIALGCEILVNCAGLHAPEVAAGLDGLAPEHVPAAYFAKGNYFVLTGRAPFSHLIYPVPEAAGLGVHLTLDMAGQARFGPDVEWISEIDYNVDPRRGDVFYEAIRSYWPDLADGTLEPGYAGIRPKIQAPGEPPADFVISGLEAHGVGGLVNLFGIESPGLTASLAIAQEVAHLLR